MTFIAPDGNDHWCDCAVCNERRKEIERLRALANHLRADNAQMRGALQVIARDTDTDGLGDVAMVARRALENARQE